MVNKKPFDFFYRLSRLVYVINLLSLFFKIDDFFSFYLGRPDFQVFNKFVKSYQIQFRSPPLKRPLV
jgi:hypothetical protein